MTKDRGGDFMPLPILTALRAAGIIAAGATGSLPLALIAGAVTEAMVSTETQNSGESETKTAEAQKNSTETTDTLTEPTEAATAAGMAAATEEAAKTIGNIMERASLKTGDNFSDEKKEYTVAEAADLLGISQYTVKKKIREKKLLGRIDGKKYMVFAESIQEYSKNAKKSGHILGDPVSGEESATEAWKNPALLEKSIESARLQQEIFSLEMEKLELSKKMAKKSNDEDQVDKLSQQIIDKKIQILEISKEIKIFEAQILYLSEHPDLSQDNDEDINIKSFMEDDSDFFTKDDSDLFPETDRAVEKEPNRKKIPKRK